MRPRNVWTPQQESYLEGVLHKMDHERIARNLNKTRSDVASRARRLGLTRYGSGYTLKQLKEAFGCHQYKIYLWIERGWLKGQRRHTLRKERDIWFFSDKAVYDFVTAHPEEVNKERADPLWLREVLAGPYGLGVLVSPDCD